MLHSTYNNMSHGGGLFIGNGNTVTINGGIISSGTASSTGGAIYNEGHLTLQNGAQIKDNWAYYSVPGILNDGYLKVDTSTLSGNRRGDWSTGSGHILSSEENGGLNIYAKKDVIITPNGQFDGNDVRVID